MLSVTPGCRGFSASLCYLTQKWGPNEVFTVRFIDFKNWGKREQWYFVGIRWHPEPRWQNLDQERKGCIVASQIAFLTPSNAKSPCYGHCNRLSSLLRINQKNFVELRHSQAQNPNHWRCNYTVKMCHIPVTTCHSRPLKLKRRGAAEMSHKSCSTGREGTCFGTGRSKKKKKKRNIIVFYFIVKCEEKKNRCSH